VGNFGAPILSRGVFTKPSEISELMNQLNIDLDLRFSFLYEVLEPTKFNIVASNSEVGNSNSKASDPSKYLAG
jgi:hypothetical protein